MAPMIKPSILQGWWLRPLAALGRRLLLVPEGVLLPTVFCLHIALGRPPFLAFAGLAISITFLLRTALLILAGQALDAGAYRRASRLARWSLYLHPLSADGLALWAQARRSSGDLPAAQEALHKAIGLFPGHGALHAEMSVILAASGDTAGARAHALYALLLNADRPWGYSRLAELALQVDGAAYEAIQLARRALSIARHPAERAHAHVLLAEALAQHRQQRAAEAELKAAMAELAACPAGLRAELLYRLGLLNRRLGDMQGAEAALRRVATTDPEGRFVGLAWRALHELDL
ncbi:MAG: hypothetical protein KatS3mg057_3109 [Herpetosiphonaceae bacterium]|nr:MAG: hypothetical protein KatS3mg057_3109 [Herpetosiphonaceae bacterium]